MDIAFWSFVIAVAIFLMVIIRRIWVDRKGRRTPTSGIRELLKKIAQARKNEDFEALKEATAELDDELDYADQDGTFFIELEGLQKFQYFMAGIIIAFGLVLLI